MKQTQRASIILLLVSSMLINSACTDSTLDTTDTQTMHSVIFDTDANNELDDQNALAYLLLNGDDFIVRGITSNATYNGGDAAEHLLEAERVLRL